MAFGDNSFGDSKPTIGKRGRGNRGGIGGGGGGGGGNTRNRNRNNNNGNSFTQDIGTAWTAPPPSSSGDPFDDVSTGPDGSFGGAGSILENPGAFGAPESWRQNATGLLNQGGIFNDRAFGSQQGVWLDDQMQNWYDQWQGQGKLAGDDAPNFLEYMTGIPGTAAPAGGVTADWLQGTYGPAMQQYLTARYESMTPRQRGTQTGAWNGPRRVIQF